MNLKPLMAVMVPGGLLLSGCAGVAPDALRASGLDQAALVDRNFCAAGEASSLPVDPIQAEGVEPLYAYVHSGRNDSEARLQGAELRVRARPDISSEWLAHQIECHTAKALLGAEQARADDPFVVPSGWVDASVRFEGGSFVVALRPKDPDRAREVLARAEAFVSARQHLALR
jgi:hypothetical protein